MQNLTTADITIGSNVAAKRFTGTRPQVLAALRDFNVQQRIDQIAIARDGKTVDVLVVTEPIENLGNGSLMVLDSSDLLLAEAIAPLALVRHGKHMLLIEVTKADDYDSVVAYGIEQAKIAFNKKGELKGSQQRRNILGLTHSAVVESDLLFVDMKSGDYEIAPRFPLVLKNGDKIAPPRIKYGYNFDGTLLATVSEGPFKGMAYAVSADDQLSFAKGKIEGNKLWKPVGNLGIVNDEQITGFAASIDNFGYTATICGPEMHPRRLQLDIRWDGSEPHMIVGEMVEMDEFEIGRNVTFKGFGFGREQICWTDNTDRKFNLQPMTDMPSLAGWYKQVIES